jgi:hypothetical protein
MSIILSVIIIVLCIFGYIYKKYNILLFLLVLSLFGDIFEFKIGISFKLHHFIVLLSLPKLLVYYFHSNHLKKYLKYLFLEFILILILGVIFGLIFPFDDPYACSRLFTQTPAMRAIIFSGRMLLELYIIILVVYWINTNKINLDLIIKTISIVLIINVSVAIIDYFSGYIINNAIYPNIREISGRFSGLSGEPRAFGRYSAFGLVFLMFFQKTKNVKLRSLAMILSIIGIFLSLSASSIVITIVGVTIYMIYKRKFKAAFGIFLLLFLAFSILNTNVFFQQETLYKINMILGQTENNSSNEKVSIDEPTIFSRFEVFDRAALNFFYHNPGYLFFGVGPNLISIPASLYLTRTDAAVYVDGINSVPHTMFINILSRSGIFGIVLNTLFFIVLFKRNKTKRNKYFFATIFIMSLIVETSTFYFLIGLTISLIIQNEKFINMRTNLNLKNEEL